MFSKMMYDKKERPLQELINNLNIVSEQIKENNHSMFTIFMTLIDQQLELVNLNFVVRSYKNSTFSDIILSLCYKNLISLLSAVNLMKQGFLGTSKIIFRNVYESLLIGKLLGVTHDYSYYEKWNKGAQFSMKKDIFSRLQNKTSKESLEFWDILNKYNHSTIYAQDFWLEIDEPAIANCNNIINCLLEMNYHLLNTFVCKYYHYYLNLYFKDYYNEKKNNLRINLSLVRKNMDPRCIKVVKDYSSIWHLK